MKVFVEELDPSEKNDKGKRLGFVDQDSMHVYLPPQYYSVQFSKKIQPEHSQLIKMLQQAHNM